MATVTVFKNTMEVLFKQFRLCLFSHWQSGIADQILEDARPENETYFLKYLRIFVLYCNVLYRNWHFLTALHHHCAKGSGTSTEHVFNPIYQLPLNSLYCFARCTIYRCISDLMSRCENVSIIRSARATHRLWRPRGTKRRGLPAGSGRSSLAEIDSTVMEGSWWRDRLGSST